MNSKPDNIYASPLQQVDDFCFDDSVVDVFPDMIQRSIPGYATILGTIGKLTAHFHQPDCTIYDLGCSLGAASLAMRRALNGQQGNIIAIDNSDAMVARCQRYLNAYKSSIPAQVILGDIQQADIQNASVVVLNFTLQFIPRDERITILQRIYDGLVPGGVLILSEKLSHEDDVVNNVLIDLHHDFKRANGYSELEISQKRTALENVMLTDTIPEHLQRLKHCGFTHPSIWYQCFNFFSLFAIKPNTQQAPQ